MVVGQLLTVGSVGCCWALPELVPLIFTTTLSGGYYFFSFNYGKLKLRGVKNLWNVAQHINGTAAEA